MNSWFAFTLLDGHVGVQNKRKMSLAFCTRIDSNSRTFFLLINAPTWLPLRQVQAKDRGIVGVAGCYEDTEELCHWWKYGDMNL